MKLIWKKSGDYILCDPLDHKLVECWIDKQAGQCWKADSMLLQQQHMIEELNQVVKFVSEHISKLNIELVKLPITGIDQDQLNMLHRNWVFLYQNHPNISALFDPKTDNQFSLNLNKINELLHKVEGSFSTTLRKNGNFINDCMINSNLFGRANVMFPYNILGRSTYEKWINFDENVNSNDTNNFKELPNSLMLNIQRSYINNPPIEYLAWSKFHSTAPVPHHLMIANFKDLEVNLTEYRRLFLKNFTLASNDVIFEK